MKSHPITPQVHREWIFFSEAKEFFEQMLIDLKKAQKEVFVETYIFRMDKLGLKVLDILGQLRQKGVKVYLSVDAVGSFAALSPLRRWAFSHGIYLSVYNPGLGKLNRRNHRKIVLIDQQIGYFGSFNITQEHWDWVDVGLRLLLSWEDGQFVKNMLLAAIRKPHQQSFLEGLKIWKKTVWPKTKISALPNTLRSVFSRSKPLTPADVVIPKRYLWRFLFNYPFFRRIWHIRLFYRLIKHSQHQIDIASPYFLPRSFFLRALINAAKRGVRVRVILPERTDVWAVKMATFKVVEKLAQTGVQVYYYKPRIWHAKAIILDNVVLLGSHNWNHRSFLHDLEVLVASKNPDLVKTVKQFITHSLEKSDPVESKYSQLSWWQKILSTFFYWFRYWM